VEELYSMVQAELRRSGFEELLSSGIVITGGSSSLQGMVELGEEIFHMPVRLGLPNYRGGLEEVVLTPRCSTGIGLIAAGLEQFQRHQHTRLQGNSFKRILERMRSWFQVNF
jgi:cell division protein FtsA